MGMKTTAMASTSKSFKPMKTSIEQFCAITGASKDVAKRMLEVCNGNLEVAINMHVDAEESQTSNEAAPKQASTPTPENPQPDATAVGENSDGVRAPIPPTRGVLVEEPFSFGVHARRKPARSIFDGFRDFEAETRRQEEELRNPSCTSTQDRKKRQTLEDLFRPPLDLMYKGTFEMARQQGQVENKWLMVNVQNVQEFNCQILNRDVWSNPAVKSIVHEHFVFYQVYHDSDEGRRYMQFYKVEEWPYIAILDPRTGENLIVWNRLDSLLFCDLVTEFLSRHPSVDGSSPSLLAPPRKRAKMEDSIVDASEDSQLEAAIKASLMDTKNQANKSAEEHMFDDSDIETFESDTEASCSSSKIDDNQNKSSCVRAPCTNVNNRNHQDENCCESDEQINGENADEENSRWEEYLGNPEDAKSNVQLRFPDGNKKQLTLPASSKLKALILYVALQGFTSDKFELVTNFPRRKISHLDELTTLKEAGLYPQETIFVQSR